MREGVDNGRDAHGQRYIRRQGGSRPRGSDQHRVSAMVDLVEFWRKRLHDSE